MAAELWESERQRAALYVERASRDRAALCDAVFARIRRHVVYSDHQRELRASQLQDIGDSSSEDEETHGGSAVAAEDDSNVVTGGGDGDLALDFLSEVDADDMKSLLEAEVAVAVESVSVTTTTPAAHALAPIAMPSHLSASTTSTPSDGGANTVVLKMASPRPHVGGLHHAIEDAGVSALMDELQIDVRTLSRQQDEERERKTEESTPPNHVLEPRLHGQSGQNGSDASKAPSSRKSLLDSSFSYVDGDEAKPRRAQQEKSVAVEYNPEAVGDEMHSWVSGERHPDVIKRKESLRQRRRPTSRYGVSTYEEQVSIRRIAKYQALEGDGSSDDVGSAYDSDFDTDEVQDEPDEPFSDTDLLPDDYVHDERAPTKSRTRRRIRQRESTTPPRESKSPRKIHPATISEHSIRNRKRKLSVDYAVDYTSETVSLEHDENPNALEEIDLRSASESSGDDSGGGDQSSDFNASEAFGDTEDGLSGSLILRLKVSKSQLEAIQQSSNNIDSVEGTSKAARADMEAAEVLAHFGAAGALPGEDLEQESKVTEVAEANTARDTSGDVEMDDGYGTDELADEDRANGSDQHAPHLFSQTSHDAAEDSDTGTVDFEEDNGDLAIEVSALETGPLPPAMVPANVEKDGDRSPPALQLGPKLVTTTLQPVEPHVKMSPQSTKSQKEPEVVTAIDVDLTLSDHDSSRAEAPEVDDDIESDTGTVNFDEVSEIDFGSDESDIGGGEEEAEKAFEGTSVVSSEEMEFAQFFTSKRRKLSARNAPVADQANAAEGRATAIEVPSKPVETSPNPAPSSANPNGIISTSPSVEKRTPPRPMSSGSNGLRAVRNINTTIVAKGKFQQTRRAIMLVDDVHEPTSVDSSAAHDPKKNLLMRSRHHGAPPALFRMEGQNITSLQLRRSISDGRDTGTETASKDRYLKYDGGSATKPSTASWTPGTSRTSTKDQYSQAAKRAAQRFGSKSAHGSEVGRMTPAEASSHLEQASFLSTLVGTGGGALKPREADVRQSNASTYVPPREPQIDVYVATGAQSQVEMPPSSSGHNHKRPSSFEKSIEEAKRTGQHVKKGLPPELNPRAPIPKKKKPSFHDDQNDSHSYENGKRHESKKKGSKSKRSQDNAPSYYGPPGQRPQEHSRKDHGGRREHRNTNNGGKRNGGHKGLRVLRHDQARDRTPSSHVSSSRTGCSSDHSETKRGHHSHSRSTSPDARYHSRPSDDSYRDRDHGHGSRHRESSSRSRSRSRSRERRHSEDQPRESKSCSPSRATEKSTNGSAAVVLDRAQLDARVVHAEVTTINLSRVKPSGPTYTVPSQKLVRSAPHLYMSADDPFIADSDDEIEIADEYQSSTPDVRVPLDGVKINYDVMKRSVYVANLIPGADEVQLELLFADYGIALDRDTGFPAIQVFMCQRTHRARGDARVTFVSAERASRAVTEVNAKIDRNSRISVRAMDEHTMRVLEVQFNERRDTWRCPNERCRSEVSVWTVRCPECKKHRVFPHSSVKISPTDWLCSICYTSNDRCASKCGSCAAATADTSFQSSIFPLSRLDPL